MCWDRWIWKSSSLVRLEWCPFVLDTGFYSLHVVVHRFYTPRRICNFFVFSASAFPLVSFSLTTVFIDRRSVAEYRTRASF